MLSWKKCSAIIIACGVTFSAYAFESPQVLVSDGASWLNTTGDFFRFDKRWEWEDVALLAAISSTALYLKSNKEYFREKTQAFKTSSLDKSLTTAEVLGQRWFLPQVAGVLYGTGFITSIPPLREVGFLLAESYFFTVMIAVAGQAVLAEDRPKNGGEMNYFKFSNLGHGVSGHAAVAASLSGPLNAVFFKTTPQDSLSLRAFKYVGKSVVYGAPLLTAWQRIHFDKHYLWNVLLGSAIGYSVGEMVAGARQRREQKIIPQVTPHSISLSYRF